MPPDGRVASGSGSAPVSGSVLLLGGSLAATEAGTLPAQEVLGRLGTPASGLTSAAAAARLLAGGPNAVRSHHARALHVLARQLRSAILLLLVVTAAASYLVGNQTDAVIIGVILLASVGLGFGNEYRAERAAAGAPRRDPAYDGRPARRPPHGGGRDRVVVGDVVHLSIGAVVPADLRLLSATGLECNEAVLTGESVPVEKSLAPVADGRRVAGLTAARSWAPSCPPAPATAWSWPPAGGRVRPHRARPRRAAAGDRLPGRAAQVLGAARAGGRWC